MAKKIIYKTINALLKYSHTKNDNNRRRGSEKKETSEKTRKAEEGKHKQTHNINDEKPIVFLSVVNNTIKQTLSSFLTFSFSFALLHFQFLGHTMERTEFFSFRVLFGRCVTNETEKKKLT